MKYILFYKKDIPKDLTRFVLSDGDSTLTKDGLRSHNNILTPRATLNLKPLNTPMDKKRITMAETVLSRLLKLGLIVDYKSVDTI